MQYELITRTGAMQAHSKPHERGLTAPPAIVELVPASVARENLVFPLSLQGEVLTLAAIDSNNIMLADKLAFMLNKKIRLVAYPRDTILAAINAHYRHPEFDHIDSMLAEAPASAAPRRLLRAKPEHARLDRTVTEHKRGWRDVEEDDEDALDLIDDYPEFEHTAGFGVGTGQDYTAPIRSGGMLYYIVEEGQRVLVVDAQGNMELVTGPRRILRWRKRFRPMQHFVAHPGDFLVVQFRDGRQEHLAGPAEVWFDPRIHLHISRQDALQVAAKEAVVVYSRNEVGAINRRIVHGPTLFVPAPGEWLHTFTWHGSEGGSEGVHKVAKGLVFQKLWLMPDQMYHDVADVRTADDAVLTIRLMMFFELLDIERMLETTHDPIGDFINAATSDVVDFTGHHSFESFKQNTSKLNDLDTYKQLTIRAQQSGYRINKVVYRGYGAPERLQAMHDQAIEARTKLQLERATEQQAQELEDFKLNAQITRAAKRRTEQATEVQAELELTRQRQEAELKQREAAQASAREQRRADTVSELEMRAHAEMQHREHLAILAQMGVDLTAYLTQARADQVIELRGNGAGTHLHLERKELLNGQLME